MGRRVGADSGRDGPCRGRERAVGRRRAGAGAGRCSAVVCPTEWAVSRASTGGWSATGRGRGRALLGGGVPDGTGRVAGVNGRLVGDGPGPGPGAAWRWCARRNGPVFVHAFQAVWLVARRVDRSGPVRAGFCPRFWARGPGDGEVWTVSPAGADAGGGRCRRGAPRRWCRRGGQRARPAPGGGSQPRAEAGGMASGRGRYGPGAGERHPL